jgi:Mn2+-dependent serine/threonine protein kinase
MPNSAAIVRGAHTILFDQALFKEPTEALFDAQAWPTHSALNEGRGTVHFVSDERGSFLLKPFLRGGLVAKFVKDRYVFTGLLRTRMAREWSALRTLRQCNLPVPLPVATCVTRKGLFYEGSTLYERIPKATSFREHLLRGTATADLFAAVGKMLAVFHNKGVFHPDLNAGNILVAEDALYLIDFDRFNACLQRSDARVVANLERLKRSLEKLAVLDQDLLNDNWQALLEGHQSVAVSSAGVPPRAAFKLILDLQ